MMEDKLLSIFIPTFNRSHLIGDTLEAFINQVAKYHIPIVISDNCSDDNTYEVVKSFRKIYPEIIYHRNDTNLGFDMNVIKMADLVQTKYCWLFGDDDIIKEGAIDTVLDIIKNNFDLVVVNASLRTFDMSSEITYQHLKKIKDRTYSSVEKDAVFVDLISYTSFIGSLIVNKEKWCSVDNEKFLKTGFVHVGVVFEYISNGCNIFYHSKPLVNIRLGNSGWSYNSFEIWHILWVKTIKNIPNYSDIVKKNVYISYKDLGIIKMLVERAKGTYSMDTYNRFFKNDSTFSIYYKFFLVIISFIPIKFLKFFWVFYLQIKKPPTLEYQLFELRNDKKVKTNYI